MHDSVGSFNYIDSHGTMEIYDDDDGVSSRFCTTLAAAGDSENDSAGNS